jgi:nitroreductase
VKQSNGLAAAVERALHAPSVHNTQPWRWRIGDRSVDLYADWSRHLISTDPDRRDLLLSCGAALDHLQVALADDDAAAQVQRLPSPGDLGHLARITVHDGSGDVRLARLSPAIERRRTDRRRLSSRPVPAGLVARLVEEAGRRDALLVPVVDPRSRIRLLRCLVEAGDAQDRTPGYSGELQSWTRRHAAARDGIPAASVPPPRVGSTNQAPLRRLPPGQLKQPPKPAGQGLAEDAAEILVLGTAGDDPDDQLRAGEATSAVLLAATRLGLATTPLSQALEVETVRRDIRRDVLHSVEYPQLLIRVGWPVVGAPALPATPRRDLASVLLPAVTDRR